MMVVMIVEMMVVMMVEMMVMMTVEMMVEMMAGFGPVMMMMRISTFSS